MVVEACYGAGVSLSAVSIAHGLNPNMVRRWCTDFETGIKDLPITNKERILALIASGQGRTEQPDKDVPTGNRTVMPVDSEQFCERAVEPVAAAAAADDTPAESQTDAIGDFLPIKVTAASSPPCRVEIQVRRMDSGHSLHIALAQATVNDCVAMVREFLQ
jgi:hypothetical protein